MDDTISADREDAFDPTFVCIVGVPVVTLLLAVDHAVTAAGFGTNSVFAHLTQTVGIVETALPIAAWFARSAAVNIGLLAVQYAIVACWELADSIDTYATLTIGRLAADRTISAALTDGPTAIDVGFFTVDDAIIARCWDANSIFADATHTIRGAVAGQAIATRFATTPAAVDTGFIAVEHFVFTTGGLTKPFEADAAHAVGVFVTGTARFAGVADGSSTIDPSFLAVHFAITAGW